MHDLISKTKSYIKKLKRLSRAKRVQILWSSVVIVMIIIILVWSLTLPGRIREEARSPERVESEGDFSLPNFEEIREKVQEGIGGTVRELENIASQHPTTESSAIEPTETVASSGGIQSLVPKDQIIHTIKVNQTLDKNEFSITVDRIEFTDDKTIIYLTLDNQALIPAAFREGNNIIIMQDQEAFLELKVKEDLFKDYLLPDTVEVEKQLSGVVCFDKIFPDKPFTLQFLSIYHGCSSCNGRDYIFKIN